MLSHRVLPTPMDLHTRTHTHPQTHKQTRTHAHTCTHTHTQIDSWTSTQKHAGFRFCPEQAEQATKAKSFFSFQSLS